MPSFIAFNQNLRAFQVRSSEKNGLTSIICLVNSCHSTNIQYNVFEDIGRDQKRTATVNHIGTALHLIECNNGDIKANQLRRVWQIGIFIDAYNGYSGGLTVISNQLNDIGDNGIRSQYFDGGVNAWGRLRRN